MNDSLPTPTVGFFRRESGVVVPSLVDEILGTVGKTAPYECGNRINHLPEFGLRLLDLVKRISESCLRPLAFNRDASDVPCAFNEREVIVGGNSRLVRVQCESAQYLVVLRQDWF